MTNQERLAELIGEEGYQTHPIENASALAYRLIDYPLPIAQLIEIAERRLFEWCLWQYRTREDDGQYWVEWGIPQSPKDENAHGDTLIEAEMAVAIKAMERLQQEREKEV